MFVMSEREENEGETKREEVVGNWDIDLLSEI